MNSETETAREMGTVHIDHAAAITVRMPTAAECSRGYPAGFPVLVVTDGPETRVFPHWVTVTFSEPHGQPEPDKARGAAAYVLGIIGERLNNLTADISDLAISFGRSPCGVVDLAAKVREEEEASWRCPDASVCPHGERWEL